MKLGALCQDQTHPDDLSRSKQRRKVQLAQDPVVGEYSGKLVQHNQEISQMSVYEYGRSRSIAAKHSWGPNS